MALSPLYIPAFEIEEVILDKDTGAPLSGGWVYFYKDSDRDTLKNVFQLTGISPNYTYIALPNPMQLSAIGTFVDGTGAPTIPYFYPYDDDGEIERYFVQVTSSGGLPPLGVEQFTREAEPYVFGTVVPPDQINNSDNELCNPQFVETYFNNEEPCVLTFSGAANLKVPIAPDWDLIVSGTGTITVERIGMVEINTPSNPPFSLDIQSAGISTFVLRQNLYQSPRLWARSFVSGYFIAASQDNAVHDLQMQYNPSGGTLTSNIVIDQQVTSDGSYNEMQGSLEIVGTINPDSGDVGYVNIDIIIPVGAHVRVSSFQLVGTESAVNLGFDEESTPRQVNELFHDYKNSMLYMPKESVLAGWVFAQNLFQFEPTALTNRTAQCQYIADQTILFQPATSQVATGKAGVSSRSGLIVEAQSGATDARFALIQYVAPQTIASSWGYWMSSLARCRIVTSHGTQVRIKMRLIYRASLPSTIGATEPISSWTLGQDPTFAAGWTAIAPLNDPAYLLPNADSLDEGTAGYPPFAFNQFQLPVATNANETLGIVFYIMEPLDSTAASMDSILIDSISLVQNQFAVQSAPLTMDQAIAAQRYYYESTYEVGTLPATVTDVNAVAIPQRVSFIDGGADRTVIAYATSFNLDYSEKQNIPTITIYNPDGTANQAEVYIYSEAAIKYEQPETFNAKWVASFSGTARTSFIATSGDVIGDTGPFLGTGSDLFGSANILIHATYDSRLGR